MEEKQRHTGGKWRRTSGQGDWRFEEEKQGVAHGNGGAEALGRRRGKRWFVGLTMRTTRNDVVAGLVACSTIGRRRRRRRTNGTARR
ncbi:unnamed protein product [Linum trigynum]|uniref:Uncharacterized protein n=1 Tax=Linum trigynum TaxID=586398 RepID=A0AAV2CJL6_9ROSI